MIPTRSKQRLRVLIAEDDKRHVEHLARLLRPSFDVEATDTFEGMLRYPSKATTDVVLVGLRLPDTMDLDPFDFIKATCESYQHAAVVVLLDDDSRRLTTLLRRAGAKGYIVKGTEERSRLREQLDEAYAAKEYEIGRYSTGESMVLPIDREALMRDVKAAVHEEIRRPRSDVHDIVPPTFQHKLRKFISDNWKFLGGGLIAALVYLVDFRDRIRNFTTDIETFQAKTSEAVKSNTDKIDSLEVKQRIDVDELTRAVVRVQVLSVESTEQLQREIRVANPRVTFPEDNPTLKKAKDQVREIKATQDLFDEEIETGP